MQVVLCGVLALGIVAGVYSLTISILNYRKWVVNKRNAYKEK